MQEKFRPPFLVLLLIGTATGILSGLFGVGGGIILVPLLTSFLNFDQRLAAGTSVGAVLPPAIVGGTGYAINGDVNWGIVLSLSLGIIVGARIGSYFLQRLPQRILKVLFVCFLVVVIISLWFVIPDRSNEVVLDLVKIISLLLVGIGTGVLATLVGVGGGIVIVPTLVMAFGASDLIAKGSSLLMMVPGSLSATLGNIRYKNIHLYTALVLGISAGVTSPVGILISTQISPLWSNILFSLLLLFVAVRMVRSLTSASR